MTKIGEQVTETLKYTPASLIIKRIIRPKYIKDDGSSILIASLPSRPIEKGIPEASLLAHILVCKFVDHLPFYRQIQRFKRDYQWMLHKSTINSWFISVCTLLKPLYLILGEKVLESGYIQVDESPIKVLDPSKPKTTHQGYQWVYHSPELKLVWFDYRKGRGMDGPKELLSEYEGWLQCDGYSVYDAMGKQAGISLVGCGAHARRKFYDANQSDRQRSDLALTIFQKIYAHERKIKHSTIQERKEYRNIYVRPLLFELKEWVQEQSIKVLPKSPMGKAMIYLQNQWPKLIAVLEDGRLEFDNNLIENTIRPLALGRKNYLFAGSHDAAQRIAMMYSFFGSCKAQNINPYKWLKSTLEKIPDTKLSDLHTLLPGALASN
jgi:transposase